MEQSLSAADFFSGPLHLVTSRDVTKYVISNHPPQFWWNSEL
jgi:hypothetical protein